MQWSNVLAFFPCCCVTHKSQSLSLMLVQPITRPLYVDPAPTRKSNCWTWRGWTPSRALWARWPGRPGTQTFQTGKVSDCEWIPLTFEEQPKQFKRQGGVVFGIEARSIRTANPSACWPAGMSYKQRPSNRTNVVLKPSSYSSARQSVYTRGRIYTGWIFFLQKIHLICTVSKKFRHFICVFMTQHGFMLISGRQYTFEHPMQRSTRMWIWLGPGHKNEPSFIWKIEDQPISSEYDGHRRF